MNSMARSVLTLASYDPKAGDLEISNVLRQSIQLAGIFPMLAVYSYHAYNHYEKDGSMYIHRPDPELSTAENFLRMLRPDMKYTELEARVLDVALLLHAEHGGGNNSTFTTRRGHFVWHRYLLGHGGCPVLPQRPSPRRCQPDGDADDAEHPRKPARHRGR